MTSTKISTTLITSDTAPPADVSDLVHAGHDDTQDQCEHCHPKKAQRRDAVRNRERLIRAAHEVFAASGVSATMDDIAHHAGLGVGTAYRHFNNKYELANAIFESAVVAFVSSAEEATSGQDPWQAFADVVECVLDGQVHDRAFRELMLGVGDQSASYRAAVVAQLAPAFERAKAAKAVRADAELSDPIMVIVMLCHLTDTFAQESPHIWRRYLPALLDGLRPDGPLLHEPALTGPQLDSAYQHRPNELA